MVSLTSLIKQINKFYKLAFSNIIRTAQEEDDNMLYYDDIFRAAQELIQQGYDTAGEDLLEIANKFKASLEIKQGYSTVNSDIRAFMNKYSDAIEDNSELEDLLNEVISILRDLAGGSNALKALDNLDVQKKLEKIVTQYEESEEPSAFETEMGEGFKGHLQQAPSDKAKPLTFLDQGAGGDKTDLEKSKKHHTFTRGLGKSKSKKYINEIKKYEEDAKDIADPVLGPKINSLTKELVEALTKLVPLAEEKQRLQDQADLLIEEDPELNEELSSIRREMEGYERIRNYKKQQIGDILKGIDLFKLEDKLKSFPEYSENEDPKLTLKRVLLEQEISQNKSLLKREGGRRLVSNLRSKLIKLLKGKYRGKLHGQLVGEVSLSNENIQQLLKEIEEAQSLTRPLGPEGGRGKGTGISEREKEWKKQLEIISKGDLEGLALTLGKNIANVKMGIKKDLVAKLLPEDIKLREHTDLKVYRDRLASAIQSGSTSRIKSANKELIQAALALAKQLGLVKLMDKEVDNHPILQEYAKHASIYYGYRDNIKKLWKDLQSEDSDKESLRDEAINLVTLGRALLDQNLKSFNSHNETVAKIIKILVDLIDNL